HRLAPSRPLGILTCSRDESLIPSLANTTIARGIMIQCRGGLCSWIRSGSRAVLTSTGTATIRRRILPIRPGKVNVTRFFQNQEKAKGLRHGPFTWVHANAVELS